MARYAGSQQGSSMRLKSGSTTRGRLVAVVATAAALMLPSANDAAAQMRGGFGGGGFGAGGFGGGGFGGAHFGRGMSPAGAMPNRMVDPAGRLPTVSRTGAAKRLTATTD